MSLSDFVGRFLPKKRATKPSLASTLPIEKKEEERPEETFFNNPPSGVDFSALWEEPQDPSGMAMILSGISVAIGIIIMLVVIFK